MFDEEEDEEYDHCERVERDIIYMVAIILFSALVAFALSGAILLLIKLF